MIGSDIDRSLTLDDLVQLGRIKFCEALAAFDPLLRAAKMNMVMNNDGAGGLHRENSLANPHTWSSETTKDIGLGQFDLVFTNPPFGANILIDDTNILSQYDLAAVWDSDESGNLFIRKDKDGEAVLQANQPPEILFIERCIQLLKPGTGKMAMVIPNGILNNPSLEYFEVKINLTIKGLGTIPSMIR